MNSYVNFEFAAMIAIILELEFKTIGEGVLTLYRGTMLTLGLYMEAVLRTDLNSVYVTLAELWACG